MFCSCDDTTLEDAVRENEKICLFMLFLLHTHLMKERFQVSALADFVITPFGMDSLKKVIIFAQ